MLVEEAEQRWKEGERWLCCSFLMGSSARGSLFREGKQLLPGPLFQELLTWGKEITSLYKSSHAVSCILRALPVTSRHLVFRLVYYPASKAKPIPYETVRTLFRSEQTFTVARTRLLELRILNQTSVGNAVAFWLNEDFAQNLRQILSLDIEAPFAMDDTSVVSIDETLSKMDSLPSRSSPTPPPLTSKEKYLEGRERYGQDDERVNSAALKYFFRWKRHRPRRN